LSIEPADGTVSARDALAEWSVISTERYLKVVHHIWSKRWLRVWMTYAASVFAWILGTVGAAAVIFPTIAVIDGVY